MSTRVEGAEPPVILITAKATLAAEAACLMLTVTEESANLWRYDLSEKNNSRLAYGKTITTDYMAALRRAAKICADGYQPGTWNAACWNRSRRTRHDPGAKGRGRSGRSLGYLAK